MDYLNFYSIVVFVAAIGFILCIAYFAWVMQYQDAGTPFPPESAAAKCPDDWESVPQTSRCRIPGVGATNAGSIHTDDPKYAWFLQLLAGAQLGTYLSATAGGERVWVPVTTPLTAAATADLRAGSMYVDFAEMDMCARKKWASAFGVLWDGVSNHNKC